MDLRSLLTKLDSIDQAKLLQEAEDVLEALTGIRYADVENLAKQFPPPKDTERAAALGKMARDNSLPGLFDPFTNKYVNADGNFAWIGAYSVEVDALKSKGLIPLGAQTSNFGMGQDRATAQAGNMSAQAVIDKAYRADDIMDRAYPPMANQVQLAQPTKESVMFTSGIANTLLEEFGYSKKILSEAITKQEHAELKKIIVDIKPYENTIGQVGQVMQAYIGYNKVRDGLINQIMSLINIIKKLSPKKPVVVPKADAGATVSTSQAGEKKVQESVKINLAEGAEDQWLYHSGSLAEGTLKFVNSRTNKVYARGTIMEDADGTQYVLEADKKKKEAEPERGTLQRVDDTIRAVANTWTGGWADNVEAKVNSWINGTSYGEELKKSIAHTDAASKSALVTFTDPIFKKKWSPSAYDVGGVIGIATMFPKAGITGTAALIAGDMAQEKLIREPHNKANMNGTSFSSEQDKAIADVKDTGNALLKKVGLGGDNGQGGKTAKVPFDKDVQALQQQLKDAGFGDLLGTTGPKKDGVDGQFAGKTKEALEAAVAKGYTVDPTTKTLVKPSTKVAAADSLAPGEEIVKTSTTAQSATAPSSTTDAAREYAASDANRKALNANTSAGGGNSASQSASSIPADQKYLQSIQVSTGTVANDIQKALGRPASGELGPEDVTAFTQYVKSNGGDPFDALGKLLGLTPDMAESKNSQPMTLAESMADMRSKLTQIDEAGGRGKLLWDFIAKVAGKDAEKGAANTAARDATTVAKPELKDLPVTVNKAKAGNPNYNAAKGERMVGADGKTYERMEGGSWYEVTASGKLGKGATREVQAELNVAAQTKGFDMQVMINKMASGEKLAAEEIAVIEKSLAEKFGFKAGQAWAKVVAGGGKALRWMKNNKWMTAFILLSAAGLAWWALSNKEDPEDPEVPVNGKCKPGYTLSADGKRCVKQGGKEPDAPVVTPTPDPVQAQVNELLEELNGLLKRLVDGWPDDAETAQAVTAGVEVGAKPIGQNGGQGGMAVSGQSGLNPILNTSRTSGNAGSTLDAMRTQSSQK